MTFLDSVSSHSHPYSSIPRPSCLPANLPICLSARLPACLPARLPTCPPAYMLASFLAHLVLLPPSFVLGQDERLRFMQGIAKHGRKWIEVASAVGTRSPAQVLQSLGLCSAL